MPHLPTVGVYYELVSRSARGDRRAYEVLVCRYYRKVFAVANACVQNEDDAYDIVQERLMPESYRLAVSLRSFGESSYEEIAESLLITPAAAQKRVERGPDGLRAYFRRLGRSDVDVSLGCSRSFVCPLTMSFTARPPT